MFSLRIFRLVRENNVMVCAGCLLPRIITTPCIVKFANSEWPSNFRCLPMFPCRSVIIFVLGIKIPSALLKTILSRRQGRPQGGARWCTCTPLEFAFHDFAEHYPCKVSDTETPSDSFLQSEILQ